MPTLISDIDGTVFVNGKANAKVVAYIKSKKADVVFLTNRKESTRAQTVADLKKVGIPHRQLIMNDGSEGAPTFKKRIIKEMLAKGKKVSEFIDDRADTRKAVRSLGVKVTDPSKIAGHPVDTMASYSDIEQLAIISSAITDVIEKLDKAFKK